MQCGLVGVEDAQAQQVEAGTTIHLALEHLEPVDVTFDWSITPGRRSAAMTAVSSR